MVPSIEVPPASPAYIYGCCRTCMASRSLHLFTQKQQRSYVSWKLELKIELKARSLIARLVYYSTQDPTAPSLQLQPQTRGPPISTKYYVCFIGHCCFLQHIPFPLYYSIPFLPLATNPLMIMHVHRIFYCHGFLFLQCCFFPSYFFFVSFSTWYWLGDNNLLFGLVDGIKKIIDRPEVAIRI